jgi:hypothetical protein
MSCASATNCVLIGYGNHWAVDDGHIVTEPGAPLALYTDDGGLTWDKASLPSEENQPCRQGADDACYISGGEVLSCPTASVCEASNIYEGGLMARTTDGGRLWRTVRLAADANPSSVSCASASVCVATAVPVNLPPTANVTTVERTTDGGKAWSVIDRISGYSPNDAYNSDVSDTDDGGVWCASTTHCVALLARTENGLKPSLPSSVNPSFLFYTVNGGRNWRKAHVPSLGG